MAKKNRKIGKVDEPAGSYVSQPAASKGSAQKSQSGVRYADDATARRAAEKVFKTHEELFRKLAQ